MRDEFNRSRKFFVAARVVGMRVSVDDHRDRLVGDRFDLIENRLAIARIFCVDQNNSCVRDKHGRVAAHACFLSAAGDDVQRILYFLEADRAWILLRPRDRDGERANSEQDSQYSQPFHARIIVRQ